MSVVQRRLILVSGLLEGEEVGGGEASKKAVAVV